MQACEHLKEKLMLYIFGELDPANGREIKSHLESCAGCRLEQRRLSSILAKVKASGEPPELSPREARAMVADISRKIKAGAGRTWWRPDSAFRPLRWIPLAAMAVALIITVAVIGYLNLNKIPGMPPVAQNQNEEMMLSDKDLEILDNLELLKEMDAIQKLSRVVAPSGETEFQRPKDSQTRGMKQDAYRHFFV